MGGTPPVCKACGFSATPQAGPCPATPRRYRQRYSSVVALQPPSDLIGGSESLIPKTGIRRWMLRSSRSMTKVRDHRTLAYAIRHPPTSPRLDRRVGGPQFPKTGIHRCRQMLRSSRSMTPVLIVKSNPPKTDWKVYGTSTGMAGPERRTIPAFTRP